MNTSPVIVHVPHLGGAQESRQSVRSLQPSPSKAIMEAFRKEMAVLVLISWGSARGGFRQRLIGGRSAYEVQEAPTRTNVINLSALSFVVKYGRLSTKMVNKVPGQLCNQNGVSLTYKCDNVQGKVNAWINILWQCV